MNEAYGVGMDTALLRHRITAPAAWLAAQPHPDLDDRCRLVETCRAELVWARADWLELAATAEGWPEARLPHERAAVTACAWQRPSPRTRPAARRPGRAS